MHVFSHLLICMLIPLCFHMSSKVSSGHPCDQRNIHQPSIHWSGAAQLRGERWSLVRTDQYLNCHWFSFAVVNTVTQVFFTFHRLLFLAWRSRPASPSRPTQNTTHHTWVSHDHSPPPRGTSAQPLSDSSHFYLQWKSNPICGVTLDFILIESQLCNIVFPQMGVSYMFSPWWVL